MDARPSLPHPVTSGTADQRPAPTYRLFAPWAITLATFLGSPSAGGILMALNYRRLRDRGRAKWWLVGCIVGTLALIAVGLCLPAGFPSTGLGVGALVGMQRAAKDQLGERIRRHVASGGKTEPWYKAVAIGLLSGLVVFGLIFVVLLAARDARS